MVLELYQQSYRSWRNHLCIDAYRDDGKRYVVQSDELLAGFLEMERISRAMTKTNSI